MLPSIGDKKTFVPAAFEAGLPSGYAKAVTGTVVWIHPRGRFYLVEVEVNGYKWHQAFGAND